MCSGREPTFRQRASLGEQRTGNNSRRAFCSHLSPPASLCRNCLKVLSMTSQVPRLETRSGKGYCICYDRKQKACFCSCIAIQLQQASNHDKRQACISLPCRSQHSSAQSHRPARHFRPDSQTPTLHAVVSHSQQAYHKCFAPC